MDSNKMSTRQKKKKKEKKNKKNTRKNKQTKKKKKKKKKKNVTLTSLCICSVYPMTPHNIQRTLVTMTALVPKNFAIKMNLLLYRILN